MTGFFSLESWGQKPDGNGSTENGKRENQNWRLCVNNPFKGFCYKGDPRKWVELEEDVGLRHFCWYLFVYSSGDLPRATHMLGKFCVAEL